MSKYNDIHNLLLNLYEARQYDEIINKVEKLLKNEIKNYKYERSFKFLRAKSFRYTGRFEEAISELTKLCELEEKNSFYNIELFFIYYYLGKYKEAFKMIPKIYLIEDKNISNNSVSIMELVIRRNLNLPMYYNPDSKSAYLKSQIVYYDEELALQHIVSHTHFEEALYNIHSIFNESVNLKYLMECVKKDLKSSKKINAKDVLEVYYFAISGIGYDENNICNYLKVVVCPGTHNTITMYPYAYVSETNVPVLNCDSDVLFNRNKKEKTNSRIDKFNKRFNLK